MSVEAPGASLIRWDKILEAPLLSAEVAAFAKVSNERFMACARIIGFCRAVYIYVHTFHVFSHRAFFCRMIGLLSSNKDEPLFRMRISRRANCGRKRSAANSKSSTTTKQGDKTVPNWVSCGIGKRHTRESGANQTAKDPTVGIRNEKVSTQKNSSINSRSMTTISVASSRAQKMFCSRTGLRLPPTSRDQ